MVKEEREAVGRARPGIFCILEQPRHRGTIDHVVNHEVRGEERGGNEARIGALHAERRGVDDKVGAGELLAQGKNNLDAWWLSLSTFVVLVGTLLLLIFIGEALRDALDARKRAV